jgi:hypothetical protein
MEKIFKEAFKDLIREEVKRALGAERDLKDNATLKTLTFPHGTSFVAEDYSIYDCNNCSPLRISLPKGNLSFQPSIELSNKEAKALMCFLNNHFGFHSVILDLDK